MASFKDIIPQFTPYVQQLPVEDMVRVGMQKQQLYDQGVQKIQSQIDSVAGLDVMNDADKRYLQSKLNELGNNLKTVAAGDFSNFQLVNSVSGMTSQIVKDPNIQNAISSTQLLKKQNAEMEKAMAEGKASPSNVWLFNQEVGKYLSSDQPGQKFSYRYEQYVDNRKTVMEAIKALHPNLTKVDIPYEIDSTGRINTAKIADVMRRNKIEGISEEQIEKAISASFGPQNWRQVQIDGQYEFKDATPEQLQSIALRNYENLQKTDKATLKYLEDQLATNADPNKTDMLKNQIAYFKDRVGNGKDSGKLYENYLKNLELINTNPDAVKGAIYKDGFVKQFADAFAWETKDVEIVKNPYVEVDQWRKDFAFKQQVESRQAAKDRFDMEMDVKNYQLKEKEFEQKERELKIKEAEVFGIATNTDWQPLTNPTDDVLNSQKYYDTHVEDVNNEVMSQRQQLKDAGFNDQRIDMMLANLRDGNPDNDRNVPAVALNLLESINKNENYMNSLLINKKRLKQEADKEAGVTQVQRKAIENKPPLNINWGGKNYKLSPEEILQIEAATKETTQGTRFGTKRITKVDTKGFNKRQLDFVNGMKGILYGEFLPTTPTSQETNLLRSRIYSVTNQYKPAVKDVGAAIKKSQDILNKKLSYIASDFAPVIKAAPVDKNGKITGPVAGALSTLITSRQLGEFGVEGTDDAKATEFLQEENLKDTKVIVKQQGNSYELWIKNEKEPTNIQKYKVSERNIRNIFGPEYVNTKSKESMRLTLGKGNDNLIGNPLYSPLQKSFGDFPMIKKLNITGGLQRVIGSEDEHVYSINLQKKDGRWQNFTLAGIGGRERVGYDQGINLMNTMTDESLIKAIKIEYPNFDFSQIKGYNK